jgi:hypothetical protein
LEEGFRIQESGVRNWELRFFEFCSSFGFYGPRISAKQLGDLFEKGRHVRCDSVSQVLRQNEIISALFKGALCEVEKL